MNDTTSQDNDSPEQQDVKSCNPWTADDSASPLVPLLYEKLLMQLITNQFDIQCTNLLTICLNSYWKSTLKWDRRPKTEDLTRSSKTQSKKVYSNACNRSVKDPYTGL